MNEQEIINHVHKLLRQQANTCVAEEKVSTAHELFTFLSKHVAWVHTQHKLRKQILRALNTSIRDAGNTFKKYLPLFAIPSNKH
jgi:hypothetical protein